ncbi:MAG: sugar ABC transporter permease [Spirochaetales bacterium]|nr:sugar ABC transporter permease [Spirochaetales bacterium]
MFENALKEGQLNPLQKTLIGILRAVVAVFIPLTAFAGLYGGFVFLRDSGAPQLIITAVAIVWGVGGVAALYLIGNYLIHLLPVDWGKKLTPFLFIGPAITILTWYLFLPTFRSFYLSFFGKFSRDFVGLKNYIYVFTDRTMLTAFRNNLYWLVFGTGLCVLIGLLIALLADRVKFEKIAKSLVFLPMAISFVGAGVIWKFMYSYKPEGTVQIGLLNAVSTALGGDPVAWLTIRPGNTFFLIAILVWLQTGFAMVILSAAIKQVPSSLLEAARIDGAKEFRIVFQIIIPYIKSTLVTVSTTILLLTLKVFDIVFAMTNGLFGTEVLASQQYKQMFKFLHYGRGSAISIIILIAVTPVIWYNLRQFGKREVF